jgi:hypothetical protein
MGQTSGPETLVSYQKTMPGKNPKDFTQQDRKCLAHRHTHTNQGSHGNQKINGNNGSNSNHRNRGCIGNKGDDGNVSNEISHKCT